METEKKYALLIDADNVSPKYMDLVLRETKTLGDVSIRRIYGDWTEIGKHSWKECLLENSLTPIQQYSYTTGKNASDSAMIIDAMDILYTREIDGFVIVSSDSDFTKLAMRLRESGKYVVGMGESKTPKSFRGACSVFTNIELLLEGDKEENKKEKKNAVSKKKISDAVLEVITTNENNGKDTGLGEIGSALVKKYSDFDVRNYGYSSLSRFIEDLDNFELKRNHTSIQVILKNDAKEVEHETLKAICEAVKIPVIAAGGIGDGRGLAAAFMLGACGVQMGTRFVATKECWAHQNYKDKILKAKDIDTKVTGRSTGHPVRALRNEMTKQYLDLEKKGATLEELEYLTLGGLRKAVVEGDVKNGSVMSGQIAGMIKEELTCREVIENIVAEAAKLLEKGACYE